MEEWANRRELKDVFFCVWPTLVAVFVVCLLCVFVPRFWHSARISRVTWKLLLM